MLFHRIKTQNKHKDSSYTCSWPTVNSWFNKLPPVCTMWFYVIWMIQSDCCLQPCCASVCGNVCQCVTRSDDSHLTEGLKTCRRTFLCNDVGVTCIKLQLLYQAACEGLNSGSQLVVLKRSLSICFCQHQHPDRRTADGDQHVYCSLTSAGTLQQNGTSTSLKVLIVQKSTHQC